MKTTLFALMLWLTAGLANASCYGTPGYTTCSDYSGNSYSVQRYGNTTTLQGYNASTSSSWSQNSQTYGNTTYIQGNSNGRTWNQTIQTMPGMTIQSGTDSRGHSFYRTCTAYGCY